MERSEPQIVFATQPGGTTIDQDAMGGNPFATALIELSSQDGLTLRKLPARLRSLTAQRSNKHQVPQWGRAPANLEWTFQLQAGSREQGRAALVLVVSDYSLAAAAPLLGAARDERRMASMLAGHGFSVSQGVGPTRAALIDALAAFGRRSRACDVAVIYSTGHGVEADEHVYLLPADYPFRQGYAASLLRAHAVPVARIAGAAKASRLNLVFFAGCRTRDHSSGEH